ncbi:MAG: hypothetical protein U0984_09600 [Prosthecobacter sp.]|nr:hypothetical protein [Prosthecobacter sp.]
MNPTPSENKELVMNALVLQAKLDGLRRELRELHRRRAAAKILCVAALLAAILTWLGPFMGWPFRSVVSLFGAFLVVSGLLSTWWSSRLRWSDLELARLIEGRHADLNALLLTAVEQMDPAVGETLFKERLLDSASAHGARTNWTSTVTARGMRWTNWGLGAAAVLCLLSIAFMIVKRPHADKRSASEVAAAAAVAPAPPVLTANVTPGDTEIERGTRLIVEAHFEKNVPAEATLIVTEPDGAERERVPMRLTVDQQVFGGLIARIDKDAKYRVEFGDQRSDDYRITTYVHPALERADVTITPPAYTGLPVKEIKNTLKVSALEHSDLAFRFKINKPVKEAELFAEDKTILPLKPLPDDPTVLTGRLKAEKTQKWRLHLVDEKERANKNPPWLSIKVQENQLAKIEVVFPKRDIQVSALQELPVEAKIWDDLGVTRSGASFSIAGKAKDVDFKHGTTTSAKKEDVKALLAMEQENAEPRQLVSYYFWAEDKGPKGEVRRAMSDMFFADVRHFEDIFREAESPPGKPGEQKGQADKLVELQKQVVNATWRLIRDTQAGRTMEAAAPDVDVVHQSQEIALDQTKEAMEEAEDAEIKTSLTEAWKSMKDALDPLRQASEEKKKTSLNQALTFEQSALEWLHRAQSREHRVMRQKQPSQGAGQQANQNQLMNLELKQQDQRYEQEKQATEEQSAEQQENLQVLNRLKELARRQEALAEKMKELENQLAKAKTEEERQELENQLQRLQDEQEQLLRDLDDLKERMEKPENAANMAEAKEQLEQTREQVMDAAEKLKQQQLADAANAATRAQRELEKMQEDFRQKTSKRFADEMKQLRSQSREANERQKQISEALENQKTREESKDTSSSLEKMLDGSQVARQIEEQQGKLKQLLDNMRRISEEAEGNNPLLHRNLYEAVRNAQTGELEENLQEARDQTRYGNRKDAQEAERKATASVEQLQKGVEKAAESVLGSETEALRMARSELDKLLDEVRSEDKNAPAASGAKPTADSKATAQASNKPGSTPAGQEQKDAKGNPTAANETSPKDGQQPGGEPNPKGGQQPGGEPNPKGQSEQTAEAGKKEADAQGQGKEPGKGQGQSEQPGPEQPGTSPGKGQLAGGQGEPNPNAPKDGKPGQSAGDSQAGGNRSSSNRSARGGAERDIAGGGGGDQGGFFFDQQAEVENRRPLTGTGYEQWTDRLRNVEELLSQPQLRNEAAKVLDNARAMRVDHERNNLAPQADHLQARITQPLVELRDRVAEELAKRDAGNPMVPVDRDPVPPAFRDLVRRYYTELGAGK